MKYISVIFFFSVMLAADVITCNEAIDFALRNNNQVLQSEAAKAAAGYNLWSSASGHLPSASFGFTNIWNDREIVFPIDSNMVAVVQPRSQWQKTVDVTWPLFTGGSLYSATNISYYSNVLARLSYEKTRDDVRLKTLEAYYNLLKMQGVVDITQAAKALVDENTRMIEKMYAIGMIPRKDLLRSRVSSAEIAQQIQQARQGEQISRITLNMTMGKPLDTALELDTTIPDVTLDLSLEDLIAHALEQRAEFQSARLGEKIAQWGVRATRGSLLPSVAGIFHWQQDSEGSIFTGNESWRALLNVSIDLPFGLSTVADVGEAKAQHRQSRYALQQAEDGIRLEIEANYLQYQLMNTSLESAEEQLAAAAENYDAVSAGFESGESTQIELIDARNSLTTARINQINTRIDHYISYSRLMYSCGYPFGN